MGIFISTLLVVDTFFVSYYLGMHSRSVPVVDNSMKPVVPAVVPAKATPKTPAKADVKPGVKPASKHPSKTTTKGASKTKAVPKKAAQSKKVAAPKGKT